MRKTVEEKSLDESICFTPLMETEDKNKEEEFFLFALQSIFVLWIHFLFSSCFFFLVLHIVLSMDKYENSLYFK